MAAIFIEVLVLSFVMIRLIVELTKFSHKIKVNGENDPEQMHLYLSVFYTSGISILPFIAYDLYSRPIFFLIPTYVSQTEIGLNEGLIRFIQCIFEIGIFLAGALIGLFSYNKMDPLHLPHHKRIPRAVMVIVFCFNGICIFYFGYLLSQNILPIVLLALVYPLKIFFWTVIILSSFVSNLMAATLNTFPLLTSDIKQIHYRLCWTFRNSSIYFGLMALSLLLNFVGFTVSISEQLFNHPGLMQIIATVSSTLCVGCVTYVYKAKPFHMPKSKESETNMKQSDRNTCINTAEKGLDIEESSTKAAEATGEENAPLLTKIEIETEPKDI